MKWYQTNPPMLSDEAFKLREQGYNLREVIEGKFPHIKVTKVGMTQENQPTDKAPGQVQDQAGDNISKE